MLRSGRKVASRSMARPSRHGRVPRHPQGVDAVPRVGRCVDSKTNATAAHSRERGNPDIDAVPVTLDPRLRGDERTETNSRHRRCGDERYGDEFLDPRLRGDERKPYSLGETVIGAGCKSLPSSSEPAVSVPLSKPPLDK